MLFFAEEILSGLSNPRLEAELLLAGILGCDRAGIKVRGGECISADERRGYIKNVRKRASGIPLDYIRGWKDWGGMRVMVTPDVLIPRDETEYLLDIMVKGEDPSSVLDVGTGSGCLALGLAKNFPEASVLALDYSKRALKIARRNFENYGVNVQSMHSDLLEGVEEGSEYDLIVANLPYVPEGLSVSVEVGKEPRGAVFGGDDGLVLLRRLEVELRDKDIRFGALWLEFLPSQWSDIPKIFSYWQVEPVCDAGGDIYFARVSSQ